MICCKTVIGKGSPNRQGTAKTHGEPLGKDEIAATRAALGWNHEPFVIPQEVYDGWNAKAAGTKNESAWNDRFAAYAKAHPDLAAEFTRRINGALPATWNATVTTMVNAANEKAETVATRKASQGALAALAPVLPELIGGSADLMGSVFTNWPGSVAVKPGVGGPPICQQNRYRVHGRPRESHPRRRRLPGRRRPPTRRQERSPGPIPGRLRRLLRQMGPNLGIPIAHQSPPRRRRPPTSDNASPNSITPHVYPDTLNPDAIRSIRTMKARIEGRAEESGVSQF